MKRYILIIVSALALAVASDAFAQRDVYVNQYTRKNGTYVGGHYRSAPNNTTLDNYGTKGNSNPYTGKQGTRDPGPLIGPISPRDMTEALSAPMIVSIDGGNDPCRSFCF